MSGRSPQCRRLQTRLCRPRASTGESQQQRWGTHPAQDVNWLQLKFEVAGSATQTASLRYGGRGSSQKGNQLKRTVTAELNLGAVRCGNRTIPDVSEEVDQICQTELTNPTSRPASSDIQDSYISEQSAMTKAWRGGDCSKKLKCKGYKPSNPETCFPDMQGSLKPMNIGNVEMQETADLNSSSAGWSLEGEKHRNRCKGH